MKKITLLGNIFLLTLYSCNPLAGNNLLSKKGSNITSLEKKDINPDPDASPSPTPSASPTFDPNPNPNPSPNPSASPTPPNPNPTPPPGGGIGQDPPTMPAPPSPIGQGQDCLNKNSQMLTSLGFNDPYIDCQWQLMHRSQKIQRSLPGSGSFYSEIGISGSDVQAFQTYQQGYSGQGINILVTDDSFAKDHPDMQANYEKSLSVGCGNAVGSDPNPGSGSHHGVMVSGLAGAVGKNNIGVSGVAYKARVSGHNVFSCQSWSNSINAPTGIEVWTASWGADTPFKQQTSTTDVAAFENGVGRGIAYFKAAGNSRGSLSDHNFDSDNSPYVMHIAALKNDGTYTVYSSPGAGLFLASYGGLNPYTQSDPGTVTIDRVGTSYTYTTQMNGTSAATPLAAGVGTVIREVKPMSPIDLMYILAKTAIPTNVTRTSPTGISGKDYIHWTKNNKGYYHSFDIGFGKVNMDGAVAFAKSYTPKLALPVRYSTAKNGSQVLTTSGAASTIGPQSCASKTINVAQDFQVFANEFSFGLSSSVNLGNVVIFFKMASGVKAQLKRKNGSLQGSSFDHSQKWKAMAAFGENAKGTWEIEICNVGTSGSITWTDAKMEIYGFTDLNSIGTR